MKMNFNYLKEELKHCYEWTLSKPYSNTDIIKSPVFVTKNNNKWILSLNLRKIQINEISVKLILVNTHEMGSDVYIRFDLFNKSQESLQNLISRNQKLKADQHIEETICFDPNKWFCFDRYGLITENFTLYWEVIHEKCQPTIAEKVGNCLTVDLKTMINNRETSDIIVCVNGHQFFAHKAVLIARSQVFAAMFGSEMKEKLENKIDINDVEVEVFDEFLIFLYTGKSDKIESLAEDLLICADKYGVTDLKNICEEIICQCFTTESAISLLYFSIKYNSHYLKSRVINYIAVNYSEIRTNSFNNLLNLAEKDPQLMLAITDEIISIRSDTT